jgi:signal transduction protein with GAF and PtsI domain
LINWLETKYWNSFDTITLPMPKTPKSNPSKKSGSPSPGSSETGFEARLLDAVRMIDATTALTAPLTQAIENILKVAATSIGSGEASVLVRDGTEGGLRFMVAIGKVAEQLFDLHIPAGKGIAGFVFTSGQPVAVADVASEGMFYAEVDRTTGYSTQTLLATPLRAGDEIIGVLEFVNRVEGNSPFTPNEMDLAAKFADAIAPLINAYELTGIIENLFGHSVDSAIHGKKLSEELRAWVANTRSAPEHRDLISLAISLREIASRGDAERELCRDILSALSNWIDKRDIHI